MAIIIYIVGNDGAGKTSYTTEFSGRLKRAGIHVKCRHYYSSLIRQTARNVIRPTANFQGKKYGGIERPALPKRKKSKWWKLVKKQVQTTAIWIYQVSMALELHIRHFFDTGVILMDRSFLDDLIGLSTISNVEITDSFIRQSARMFPIREIIYVYGGHEVEYDRIVDNDLTKELHCLKGEKYDHFISVLSRSGFRIKTVRTDS